MKLLRQAITAGLLIVLGLSVVSVEVDAQDIVSSQLRQGFGRNKVRYKDFDWHFVESDHLRLHYEPEFEDLANRAIEWITGA